MSVIYYYMYIKDVLAFFSYTTGTVKMLVELIFF